ncbi:hypothetical protein ROA7450_03865 [Roseovarius albus]|uniref:Lipoprotein n=1 Tax=Roseovarius albus TaxID=1247867 RepID=A0A1X7A528_9RHOB|nr:hypothetical protein [Roseovarius albus]SLN70823.1 hypothetical protein ROA7450_03865 [Roseovarius albus]
MLRTIIMLLGVVVLAACPGPVPDQADRARITQVQETYDSEFRTAVSTQELDVKPGSFPKTLKLIQNGAENEQVDSFYTLIEGLIFLQTGQLGLAQAVAPEITGSTNKLATDGIASRNVVLARNYADLVGTRADVDTLRSLDRNTLEQHTQRVAIVKDIEARTAKVTRNLCRLGEADDGAAFVAAYQATSLLEADNAMSRACVPDITDAEACGRFLGQRPQLNEARDLMAAFSGDAAEASQIAQTRRKIEQDMSQRAGGAALPPPTDPC